MEPPVRLPDWPDQAEVAHRGAGSARAAFKHGHSPAPPRRFIGMRQTEDSGSHHGQVCVIFHVRHLGIAARVGNLTAGA